MLPSPSRSAGLVLVFAASVLSLVRPGQAAPMGLGPVDSYPAAIQQTRQAAEAVLSHAGKESCLRGKLTNALLKLSASCSAAGRQGGACELADRAIVVTPWSVPFMETTSRALLDAAETPDSSAP
ncbi:hypothetical protein [Synechococcus sp. CS-1328]|uniref:hypothetical protein n=1 Tax=Synechococcus sp. CS-1328 TaxID=2847976 RepID=UPI00223C03B2|nr:hypothetical protein [Synechococcus sp. CS-1328]MCT0223581.1 hypothetical protein [Synechococcus sp. CS-1328]